MPRMDMAEMDDFAGSGYGNAKLTAAKQNTSFAVSPAKVANLSVAKNTFSVNPTPAKAAQAAPAKAAQAAPAKAAQAAPAKTTQAAPAKAAQAAPAKAAQAAPAKATPAKATTPAEQVAAVRTEQKARITAKKAAKTTTAAPAKTAQAAPAKTTTAAPAKTTTAAPAKTAQAVPAKTTTAAPAKTTQAAPAKAAQAAPAKAAAAAPAKTTTAAPAFAAKTTTAAPAKTTTAAPAKTTTAAPAKTAQAAPAKATPSDKAAANTAAIVKTNTAKYEATKAKEAAASSAKSPKTKAVEAHEAANRNAALAKTSAAPAKAAPAAQAAPAKATPAAPANTAPAASAAPAKAAPATNQALEDRRAARAEAVAEKTGAAPAKAAGQDFAVKPSEVKATPAAPVKAADRDYEDFAVKPSEIKAAPAAPAKAAPAASAKATPAAPTKATPAKATTPAEQVAAVRAEQKARITAKKAAKTDPATPAKTTATQPASTANVANDPYGLSALNTDYYSSPEFLNAINTSAATQPVQTQSAVSPASTVNYGNAGLPATQASATNPYGLPPEAAAELAAFDLPTWQAEQQRLREIVSSRDAAALAAAQDTGISNINRYANASAGDDIIPGTNANIMASLGMYDPTYQAVMQTYGSQNDQKNPNDVTERSTFAVDPTASYRLVDNKTGAVIASASNPNEVKSLVDTANSISEDQGSKANWSIEKSGLYSPDPKKPLEQSWTSVASDTLDASDMGPMGSILDVALPILMNAVLPGSGLLSTMAGSALGSAASGALQSKSIGDIAKSAGISAATAGLMQGTPIGNIINKAVGSIPIVGDVARELSGGGANALSNAAADEIVVTALPQIGSSLAGSALSSSLANSIANAYPAYTPPTTQPPLSQQAPSQPSGLDAASDIVVTAQKPALPNISPFAVDPVVQNLIDQYAVSPTPQSVQEPVQQPVQQPMQEPVTAPEDIVVTAQKPELPNVSPFALDPLVQDLIDRYANQPTPQSVQEPVQQQEPDTAPEDIVVTAQKPALPNVSPFALDPLVQNLINNYAVSPTPQSVQQQQEPQTDNTDNTDAADDTITVTGSRLPNVSPFALDPLVQNLIDQYANQPTPQQQEPDTAQNDILVTAQKPVAPISVPININSGPSPVTPTEPTAETQKKSDLDKALSYLKLAGVILPLLGGGGNNGNGGTGTIPGGLGGGLNPTFSAKLPTNPTNIPGGVGTAANFAARPMGEQDWLTYGQRPEQSFFNYVPQQPKAMARGGRSTFAVNGPGTGRSDSIPAVLSDGEYVMDAETVALLGDGSSKAGAKKLDDLRVKVRKQKGRKLAQGRFSANAKNPEAYLSGGRI